MRYHGPKRQTCARWRWKREDHNRYQEIRRAVKPLGCLRQRDVSLRRTAGLAAGLRLAAEDSRVLWVQYRPICGVHLLATWAYLLWFVHEARRLSPR